MRTTIVPEVVDFVSFQNRALQTKVNEMLKNSNAPEDWVNTSAITIEVIDTLSGPIQIIRVRIKVGPKSTYAQQWDNSGEFRKDTSAQQFIRGCLLALETYLKELFNNCKEPRS